MLEQVQAGFCVIRVLYEGDRPSDYEFLEVNQGFEHATGLVNATGRRIRDLTPDHEDYWFQTYGRVARTGESLQFEHEARALGRWYSVDAVRVGEPGEDKVAVLFMDITQRKQMEMDLFDSEARFSALADGLPMPVWVLDGKGQPRFVNSAFAEFFGGEASPVPAELWKGRIHPEDVPVFDFELQAALRDQRSMRGLVRGRRAEGQWRWLEINAQPRFSPRGHFIGLAGSCTDVTERREIEMAREQLLQSERVARNAAENMARLKDEFLATLSHELRTPLTTILGWSELLLQRVEPDSNLYKGLNVIAGSALAQKRLISDMLDLSSLLLGKVQLEVEVLDLGQQISEARRAQELVAEEKGITLELELPPQTCLVLGDATRLQQVVWNLLSNAIKFTPDNGKVGLAVSAEGGHYVISVSDTGDGIAPDFLRHLFSRFSQADGTTTRRHGGLGLGLSIVQQLVELHGGTVSAASEGRGQGAVFTVRLPQYIPQEGNRPLREIVSGPIAEQLVEADALRGLHVLAVDDQPQVLDYLRRILEQHGATVTLADSAGRALEILDKDGYANIDLLLTDIGMPGMDGYALVRTLREDLSVPVTQLPAVAVTALARDDDRQRALDSGFQDHVAKPYSVGQLVSVVRNTYKRHRAIA